MTAVRDDTGKLLHMVAQMVNVTAEVYNLEALSRTVERFRKLAENATDVVFEVDRRGLLVWVSPSITSVLGWDPRPAHRHRRYRPDRPVRTQRPCSGFRGGRSGGIATDTQARFRTTHGDVRYMAAKSSPITSGTAGASHGAVIGLRDITDEHAASRSLQHSERLFRLSCWAPRTGLRWRMSTGFSPRPIQRCVNCWGERRRGRGSSHPGFPASGRRPLARRAG